MEKTSNWEWLPDLVLDLILKKLVSLSDYVRSSAVCKQWYSVAADQIMEKLTSETSRNNQLPFLMVPTKMGSEKSRSLYNLSQGKTIYALEFPVPFNRRCCGSCHGWLAFAMDDTSIILFNPFTGTQIDLPRLLKRKPHYEAQYFVKKVVLSANPITNPDYEVAAIYSDMHDIALIKANQMSWTRVKVDKILGLRVFVASDIVYHKGRIYCVNYHNRSSPARIVSIDTSSKAITKIGKWQIYSSETANLLEAGTYLVESSHGELLLLRRFLSYAYENSKKFGFTSKFEVYKVQGQRTRSKKLERVNNIGADALFLGDNYSTSVLASDFPGCRPNSIYFTDDCFDYYYPFWPRDMAIFNLKDESFDSHYLPNPLHERLAPPIWITATPTLSKFHGRNLVRAMEQGNR